jgi:Mn2+/Fe2+ NRAMP family transporter
VTQTDKKGGAQSLLRKLSAGLVTGAADDDPSGIATYSQVGAAYGYATVWSLILAMPLMIAIQAISARIGCASGRGIGENMRLHYPRWLVYVLVLSIVMANVINLAADIGAMGAATQLLIGGQPTLYAALFALISLGLQMYVPFSRYSPYLKVLTLTLFAYVGTIFVIHVPWAEVIKGIVIPKATFDAKYAVAIVAVLGTTISPYLFIWQAAQEVEEIRAAGPRKALKRAPSQGPDALERIGVDTTVGMVFSNLVAGFIILTAAVTLHAHGKTDIQSASDAAQALKPIAGRFAFWLFAAGIVGTGLLAVPVLAGSTAYVAAGVLGEKYGLENKPHQAKVFYGILIFASLAGIALNLTPINPIKALYWSAVINGLAAAPMMVIVMLLSRKPEVMGKFTLGPWTKAFGWIATTVMAIAAIVMFVTWGK